MSKLFFEVAVPLFDMREHPFIKASRGASQKTEN